MELKLNENYPNAFITLHCGLFLKKDEDWKKYDGIITRELDTYIKQGYILVKKEEKIEEKVKKEEKIEEKVKKSKSQPLTQSETN